MNKTKIKNIGRRFAKFATKTKRRKILSILLSALILLASVRVLLFIFPGDASASWWQGDGGTYLKRKQLTLTNDSSESLAADTTTAITVNTKALYDAGRIQDDCDDVRIVYQSGTGIKELTRHIVLEEGTTCATSQATKINFPLQATLANATSSTDYFMYYANRGAPTPTGTVEAYTVGDTKALLVCPFNGTTECINGDGAESPTTETGAIRYGGSKSALEFQQEDSGACSGDYVSYAVSGSNLEDLPNENMTVELWTKIDSFSGNSTLVGTRSSFSSGWHVFIESNSILTFYATHATTTANYRLSTTLNTDEWIHIAIVWNANTKSAKIYINGTEATYTTQTPGEGAYNSDSGNTFYVGRDNEVCQHTDATIDEVRISNIARYNSNFTPTTAPYVRDEYTSLLYHFDENGDDPRNTGKTLDDSGNNNHGTINGAKYVEGLVGVNSNNEEGNVSGANSYAGHEGIFIEESTTNKITNPSFDHATFNTNWTASISGTDTENTNTPYVKFGSKSVTLDSAVESYPASNATTSARLWNATDRKRLAQGFQVSSNYTITGVKLLMSRVGTTSNYYNVELQTDSTGLPSGTPITNGTSTCVAFSSIPSSTDFYTFTFATDPSLTASTQYHIVLKAFTDSSCSTEQSSADASNYVVWRYDYFDSTYTNGTYAQMNSSDVWSTQTARDFIFKLETGGSNNTDYYTAVDPDSTTSHTLSAYVYRDTNDDEGNTVDNTVAQLIWEGSAQSTTVYTDMGGGWWRLSYSANTTDSSNNYGVQFLYGEYGYVDGVQLEEKAYKTTYADGSLVSDAGGTDTYFWDDDCDGTLDAGEDEAADQNAQCSSRKELDLLYSTTNNFDKNAWSISVWVKPSFPATDHSDVLNINHQVFSLRQTNTETIGLSFLSKSGALERMWRLEKVESSDYNRIATHNETFSQNDWIHLVGTFNTTNGLDFYINGSSMGNIADFDVPAITNTTIGLGRLSNLSQAYLNMAMSDFRTYDDALTAAEVADLYQSGLVSHQQGTETDFSDPKGADPLAVWHMDERVDNTCDGTADVCDASGNGYHLASSGTSWEVGSGTGGSIGDVAQSFDGTDDYLSKASDTDFDFSASDDFTVSGWFRHSSTISGTDTIISKYESTDDTTGWKVYMDSSGYVCFGIDNDGTFTPTDSACSTATQGSLADSRWHSFDVVKDGTDSITLYIDKQQVAQDDSIAATGSLVNETTFYVGIDADGSSNPWDGDMDEIVIYPTARTSDQVKSDLNNPQVSAVLGANTTDPLMDGLIGYWKMDETALDGCSGGEDSCDSSGNGNHGTFDSGMDVNDMTGAKYGNGVELDGTDDNIGLGNNSVFDIVNELTISLWFRMDGNSSDNNLPRLMSKGNSIQTNGAYGLAIEDPSTGADYILFRAIDSDSITQNTVGIPSASQDYNDGNWHHVVATHSYSQGVQRVFLDGNELISTNYKYQIRTTSDNLMIGGAGTVRDYNGAIDEARIYNRALSPSEVKDLYEWAPGPVGYWSMDENTGSTTYDKSGNGNDGTLTSMTESSWVSGKFGSALDFDGTADYFTAGSDTSIDDIWNGGGTVEAWIYPESTATSQVFSKSCSMGWYSRQANQGLRFSHDFDTQYGSWSASNVLTLNQWQHFAITYDNTSDANVPQMFVNGIEVTVSAYAAPSGVADIGSTCTLYMGSNSSLSEAYTGLIDEARMYNYARTPAQIIEDMNAGHPLGGSPVGSPALHWQFDEMYGSTVNDSGTQGSDGTLSGSWSWSEDGKIGKSILLDTGDNFVSAGDTSWTDSLTQMTVSFWIKPNALATGYAFLTKTDDSVQRSFNIRRHGGFADEIFITIASSLTVAGGYLSTSNLDLVTDSWQHITVVYDGTQTNSDRLKVYKNAHLVSSSINGTVPTSLTSGSTSNLKLGSSDGDKTNQSAYFDEVKIYTAALTADQVKIDYNAGSSTSLGGVLGDSEASTLGDGAGNPPVGYWDFNNNTGSTAYDKSGNGNDGTLNGSMTESDWVPGKYGSTLDFDGSDDYINAGSDSSLDNLHDNAFTTSAWIKLDTLGIAHKFVMATAGSDQGWREYIGTGSIGFVGRVDCATTNAYSTSGSDEFSLDGLWHHVVMTYDDAGDRKVYLYIDGQKVSSYVNQTACVGAIETDAGDNLAIGNNTTDASSLNFDGQIDEVKIYNTALTPGQIAYEYNRGAPVGYWQFDECTGTTAYDASGNGNNGTITIGATGDNTSAGTCSSGVGTEAWNNGTTGKFNSSLDFDGTNDGITAPLVTTQTENITLSAWAYWKTTAGSQYIVYNGNGGGNGYSIAVGNGSCASGTNIVVLLAGVDCDVVSSTTAMPQNQWVHLAVTYDSSTWKLYVNGVLKHTGSGSPNTPTTATYISGRGSQINSFDGQIDDVRIYNYALSAKQIRNVMNYGAVSFR